MQPSPSDPFFLLDESLSSSIVTEVYDITGQPIATIEDEWPGRDRRNNPILDEEIFLYLETRARHQAVWITADREALRKHRNLIDAHRISVLWLRSPGRNPTFEEQLRMLCAVIGKVRTLIIESNESVYLRVRLASDIEYQPYLERLRSGLLQFPRQWETIRLA